MASLTTLPGNSPDPDFSGTILLDHIENMPAQTQTDMLAILEQNAPDVHMDVRFIVATQKSLDKKVSQGRFNRKLFQRLRAICIEMPASGTGPRTSPCCAGIFWTGSTRRSKKM